MTALSGVVTDAAQWSTEERRRLLGALDRVIDGLGAVRAAVLIAERDAGTWRGGGDRSFETWRARTAHTGQRSAVAQVRQAEQLGAAPVAAAAVTAGRVGLEHATVLARVASAGTPAQQAALARPAMQAALLEVAEREDAATFATTVARWAATVDPAGLERDHEAQRAQRYLNLTVTASGTYLKGRLDSMAGHRLTLALEALLPRPAADDDREPGQRRADALDAMARRVLAAPDTKPGGHVPPQLTMVVTPETWAAARAERDRRRAARSGAPAAAAQHEVGAAEPSTGADGSVSGVVGHPPATLEDGTPVPVTELAVAMCDCDITAVVLDAGRAPLDLGRTRRLFTGPQRRAVIARDRECGWPGCHAPARWCEIHHIGWWERDNGATSVDNGVLLCSYHHHETHRRDLTITRIPAGAAPRSDPDGGRPGPWPPVGYEFRDITGRVTGRPASSRRAAAAAWAVDSPGAATTPPGTEITSTSPGAHTPVAGAGDLADSRAGPPPAPIGPAAARTRPQVPARASREPDLEWATDPVTGARVPASFVT